MPIYHFNLANAHYDPDAEGTEFDRPEDARVEAVTFAGSYLRDHPDLVGDGQKFEVQVTDDAGARIFTVRIEAFDG